MTTEEDRMIARIEQQAYGKGLSEGFKAGKAEAYEDAAKIADEDIEWAGNNHCSCGERIRARAAEVGK